MFAPNQTIPMTRRYPDLPQKVLYRDSQIVRKIISAWDEKKDAGLVLDIFMKEKDNLSDYRFWEIMRTVWVLSGSLENAGIFRKLMQSPRKQRYYFSTPEESKKLRELKSPFKIYRACNDEKDGGLSWTLDKDYAERYAVSYGKSIILTKEVTQKEVFAFIERNNESEIIIL